MFPVNRLKFPPIIGEASVQEILVMLTASDWMFLQGVLQPVAFQVLLLAHKDMARWMVFILHMLLLANQKFLWMEMWFLLPMCFRKGCYPALIILHFIVQFFQVPAMM